MKKQNSFLLTAILQLFFLCITLTTFSQPQEVKNAIEAISSITGSTNSEKTSLLLSEAGFLVPRSLQSHWDNFSDYRKIETAYWVAESKERGNGNKFLALLTKNLSQEFESVPYEASLKKLLSIRINPQEGLFPIRLNTFNLPPQVPKEVANSIISITKYTNSKALGGTMGILKYYFELTDEEIYTILRKSSDDFDALLSGIDKASIPPTQKARIKKIALDLRQNFESANMDARLSQIIEEPEFVKEKSGNILSGNLPKEKLKSDYETFVKKAHPTPAARKFNQMKVNARGFGGVIFGNRVIAAKGVNKLDRIVWIHGKTQKGLNTSGSLEFVFEDTNVKTIQNVLWEDVYAAYNIVFVDNKNSLFSNGEGIGLTGASYPDIYNEDRTYDSIIKSNNLTISENEYYIFRCNSMKSLNLLNKKFENDMSHWNNVVDSLNKKIEAGLINIDNNLYLVKKKVEDDVAQLNKISVKKRKTETLLSDQVELIKKNQLLGNSTAYYSAIQKGKTLYNQYIQDNSAFIELYKKYQKDSSDYKAYYPKYRKQLDSFYFKDSLDRKIVYSKYETQIKEIYNKDSLSRVNFRTKYKEEDSTWTKKDSVAKFNVDHYLSRCNKIILYPILANLELGRSLIRGDVLPRTGNLLIDKLKKNGASKLEIEVCQKWLEGSDTLGWKFTDDSLVISFNKEFLQVTRQKKFNNFDSQSAVLNFNKMDTRNGKSVSIDFPDFVQVLPILTKVFYDYYRINNFAKLLAIFRWSKQNGAKFLNKPSTPRLYVAPAYSWLTKDGTVELIDMK